VPAGIIVPRLRHHVVEPDEDRQNGLAIFGLNASYQFIWVYELPKVKIAKHAHWRSTLFRGEGKDSGLGTWKAYDDAEIMIDFRF